MTKSQKRIMSLANSFLGVLVAVAICSVLVSCDHDDRAESNLSHKIAVLVQNANAETNVSTPGEGVGNLLRPDERTFELLIEETVRIGELRASGSINTNLLIRSSQLRSAFEIVGSNAAPLLGALRTNYLSGQNPGDSGWALYYMGEPAWGTLIEGLSNRNPTVQACSAGFLGILPEAVAERSVPDLLLVSRNGNEVARSSAILALDRIRPDPSIAMPPLLLALTNDPDYQVRAVAARALGGYAHDSSVAKQALISAAQVDADGFVRSAASQAVEAADQMNPTNQP